MYRRQLSMLASAGIAALVLVSTPARAQLLGTASDFAVLGATPNVTNTGASVVSGNTWASGRRPRSRAFPREHRPRNGIPAPGRRDARNRPRPDTTAAYLNLAGLVSAPILPALGGRSSRRASITPAQPTDGRSRYNGPGLLRDPGDLAHDRVPAPRIGRQPDRRRISQRHLVADRQSPRDRDVQRDAGNILALTSITIATSASLQGRALARNGTVTLDTTTSPLARVEPPPLYRSRGRTRSRRPFNTPIPTLSEWAMILLAALMPVAGFAADAQARKLTARPSRFGAAPARGAKAPLFIGGPRAGRARVGHRTDAVARRRLQCNQYSCPATPGACTTWAGVHAVLAPSQPN